MSIIYSVIAKDEDTILVEFTQSSGNFPVIAQNLLKKIKKNSKLSYSYSKDYFFHYINENNITFLCMADAVFSKRVSFAYLEELKDNFYKKYDENFNNSFNDVIKQKADYYNENPDSDKLNKLKSTFDQAKEQMVENIDKLFEREQKVEIMVKKTAQISQLASHIQQKAVQVRKEEQWKQTKAKIIKYALIIFLVFILFTMMCGGITFPQCL